MVRDRLVGVRSAVLARSLSAALAACLVCLLPSTVQAKTATYNTKTSKPATLSGGEILTISGDTVTVTSATTPTYISLNGGPLDQLLGISGIWMVGTSGKPVTGVASVAGPTGSKITGSQGTTTWTNESDPAGYGGTAGFTKSGNYIDLVNAATLKADGNRIPDDYNTGVFTFTDLSSLTGYDFGIHYLLAGGGTGNAYFSLPALDPPAVPEPNTAGTFCVVGAGVACLIWAARLRARLFMRQRVTAGALSRGGDA